VLAADWKLPARALALGLPLTLLGTAALAHWVAGLAWLDALLVGAVLSPTDPVFAAAIVGRKEIPVRLRRLLNVESGLNDGLALPAVIALLALKFGQNPHIGRVALEAAGGIALGVAVPWAAIRLERSRLLGACHVYEPINGFAIGLIVFAVASLTRANEFLAAFAAGVMMNNAGQRVSQKFNELGEIGGELLKLAAVLTFAAVISPAMFAEIRWSGYAFALLALVAVRPVALGLSLIGADLSWREWVTAVWFGPKGFASVVYGLLVLRADPVHARYMAHLIALVIAASMIAHSSTDVLFARWFKKGDAADTAGHAADREVAGPGGADDPDRPRSDERSRRESAER
jgi:NhaP-type Na+/H+ or K+/H+ antiporter